jgi:tripartite-type tricarboxylate transporter receptor subunit TctC
MELPIRTGLAAVLATMLAGGAAAQAPAWPAKPIRLVDPLSAGGANALRARAAAEGASKALGQPIGVDNKPGAGATLGADVVAKSPPAATPSW